MSEKRVSSNARLNEVLIAMSRSLLQYAGEAWPWVSSTEDDVAEQLLALVRQQHTQIERLGALLAQRVHFFDHGTYPTDYTDLQYLSLSYLLKRLIRDQEAVLAELRSAAKDCEGDPEARDLLQQLEVGVSQTIKSLQNLARADAEKNAKPAG